MGAEHANVFIEKLYALGLPRFRKEELILRDFPVNYTEDKTEHQYSLNYRPMTGTGLQSVISFRARPQPGCCGILVVYYLRPASKVDVYREEAQKLYAQTVELICHAAKAAKYGAVVISLLATSTQALELLLAAGFEKTEFINGKTGNTVVQLYKNLQQPVPVKQKFVCE